MVAELLRLKARLLRNGFRRPPLRIAGSGLLLVVALVALVAGGAAALWFGRTDRARTHAVLSVTLWSIVLPATGILVAFGAAL